MDASACKYILLVAHRIVWPHKKEAQIQEGNWAKEILLSKNLMKRERNCIFSESFDLFCLVQVSIRLWWYENNLKMASEIKKNSTANIKGRESCTKKKTYPILPSSSFLAALYIVTLFFLFWVLSSHFLFLQNFAVFSFFIHFLKNIKYLFFYIHI